MNRELLQQALDALKNGRNVRQGMGSIKLQISFENEAIAKLEQELAKPQNEFHPDWDTLQPYHERIAELEAQLALDKKADNARELGLNYEPEQNGSIRIAVVLVTDKKSKEKTHDL